MTLEERIEGEKPEGDAGETPEEKTTPGAGEGAGTGEGTPPKAEATVEGMKAELEATRKALRKANQEAAERRKRLEALEAEEKKRGEAELSELERAQAAAEEWKGKLDLVAAELDTLRLRQAFYEAAAEAKVAWANAQAQRDAFALSDLSGVEIDEDGGVSGMDKVLKGLQKERPHLFGAAAVTQPEINAGSKGGGKGEGDMEAVKRRFGL